MTDEEWQKMKNLTLYKMNCTDKERDEILPWIGGILLVALLADLIWHLCS